MAPRHVTGACLSLIFSYLWTKSVDMTCVSLTLICANRRTKIWVATSLIDHESSIGGVYFCTLPGAGADQSCDLMQQQHVMPAYYLPLKRHSIKLLFLPSAALSPPAAGGVRSTNQYQYPTDFKTTAPTSADLRSAASLAEGVL